MNNTLTIMVVGNSEVGKTEFLHEFIRKYQNSDEPTVNTKRSLTYVPTTIETYRARCCVNLTESVQYGLHIVDLGGNLASTHQLAIQNSFFNIHKAVDSIVLCFSLVDPNSFSDLKNIWVPKIKEKFKDVPIILVGTKKDLKQEVKKMKKPKMWGTKRSEGTTSQATAGTNQSMLSRESANTVLMASTPETTATTTTTTVTMTPPASIGSPQVSVRRIGNELVLTAMSLAATTTTATTSPPPPPPPQTPRTPSSLSHYHHQQQQQQHHHRHSSRMSSVVVLQPVDRLKNEEFMSMMKTVSFKDDVSDDVFEVSHGSSQSDYCAEMAEMEIFTYLYRKASERDEKIMQKSANHDSIPHIDEDSKSKKGREDTNDTTKESTQPCMTTTSTVGTLNLETAQEQEEKKKLTDWVTDNEAERLRKIIGAVSFFKVSYLEPESIDYAMDEAITQAALFHSKRVNPVTSPPPPPKQKTLDDELLVRHPCSAVQSGVNTAAGGCVDITTTTTTVTSSSAATHDAQGESEILVRGVEKLNMVDKACQTKKYKFKLCCIRSDTIDSISPIQSTN